jgi:predicted MPP superfamily phosphohydrolase
VQDSQDVTPERYAIAVLLFHGVLIAFCARSSLAWADVSTCRRKTAPWLWTLAIDLLSLAVFAYVWALFSTFAANYDHPRRLHLGEISGRLMGQALFGEAIVLAAAVGLWHWKAGARSRAGALIAASLVLCGVYVQAYRVEPNQLLVRTHALDLREGSDVARRLRILHITDIQTPSIGSHEEDALRRGLAARPDMVVMTGDYVQDALGRPTELEAARDLRSLMARIGFQAPLGIFATEGDVGPSCGDVFAGSRVRCLTDQSTLVVLPDGQSVAITGLSRGRGRERNPAVLARILARAPQADHHIVISHSPDFVDAMPWKVDLALAGHTHGGQFVLPFVGPLVTASRLPRRYAGDLHDFRGIPLHVSRGVGMERGFAPPVRFLCPPEICVVDLQLAPRRASLAQARAQ